MKRSLRNALGILMSLSTILGTLMCGTTAGGFTSTEETAFHAKVSERSPEELARRHRVYHYRVLVGPTYRADMWAALERNPSLSSSDLARSAYGSFATAWRVKHDFALLAG